ncbi:hypothetical protein LH935_27990 (plasmid) [Gordonia polyisoprenivorans]|uniref:hypothetical protein n=1 Tax=Gordonia polyisoprenivorans TaxID=84595 RepID=UPI00223491D4|nr:hypothetical protein [uncultured Gordonia sp.]UZF59333.1 hypothetical protein LH935_27990 [Gordonia polyisoprenivorans]
MTASEPAPAEAIVVWPNPSPLQDWWTIIMDPSRAASSNSGRTLSSARPMAGAAR